MVGGHPQVSGSGRQILALLGCDHVTTHPLGPQCSVVKWEDTSFTV